MRAKIEEMIPAVASMISKPKASKVNSIHFGVRCDGCGVKPITGIRYKCSACHDFDYCEDCEENIDHAHAFLKIKFPAQAPKLIITSVIDDMIPGLDINGFTLAQTDLESLFKKPEVVIPEPEIVVPEPQPELEIKVEERI